MKDLYVGNKSEENYYFNLKILSLLENEKNSELEKFLDTTYNDLFANYLNSDEFIHEINKLKKKNMRDSYIMRYLYITKNFIDFFST